MTILHHKKDTLKTVPHNNFLQLYDITMIYIQKQVYFSKATDWKTFFLLFHSDFLQRNNAVALRFLRPVNDAIRCFANSVQFFEICDASRTSEAILSGTGVLLSSVKDSRTISSALPGSIVLFLEFLVLKQHNALSRLVQWK